MKYAEYDRTNGEFLTAFSNNGVVHFKDEEGHYYQILDADNGLRGSVDPMDDLIKGYEAVRAYLNSEKDNSLSEVEKATVKAGIEVASKAIKYPFLFGWIAKLLESLSRFLQGKT
jgi:hypothetical protein